MPRNMSFMLTKEQIRNQTKTVTRRLGWDFLVPGMIVNACEQCQGLKKGQKVVGICKIRIVSNNPETLCCITQEDVIREGFPEMNPRQFTRMFCRHMKCDPTTTVNRIEFEYL